MRGKNRIDRGCIEPGDSTTASSSMDTESPVSPMNIVDGLNNRTLTPTTLSTPSSYQEFGNKISISGNMIYLNITADSPGENKGQSLP